MLVNTTKFISGINKKPSRMNPQIAYLIEWVVRKYNNNTIVEPDSEFFVIILEVLRNLDDFEASRLH